MSDQETISSDNKYFSITKELPEEFLFLSEHCQLCFLTTSRDNIPDIHIMFFTYYQKDNVVILTTKKDTKYKDIVENIEKLLKQKKIHNYNLI